MKKIKHTCILFILFSLSRLGAQNVGIGQAMPMSKLDVNGNLVIGSGYSGSVSAPVNGAIIEGNVGIGTSNPGTNRLQVQGAVFYFKVILLIKV